MFIAQGGLEQEIQAQTDFLDKYIQTFEAYGFLGETDATFGDRHFALEDIPENILEELVASNYYYDISGEFNKLSNLIGDNKALEISIRNVEKGFQEGNYMAEHILHSLSTWSKDELKDMDTAFFDMVEEEVEKYQLSEFNIVQAEFSMVHSEKYLD